MVYINENDIEMAGSISIGGNIVNKDLTQAFTDIGKACDGYADTGDGYIYVIRTMFIPPAGLLADIDTGTTPTYNIVSNFWYCPCLNGTVSDQGATRCQYFNFYPAQIPFDYYSDGHVKIYCAQTLATSGKYGMR